MKVFVTGVGGQLGHDVMNELYGRGIEAVGSDIAPAYSGVQDGTPVTGMPYVQLDITDEAAVSRVLSELQPDAVVHCAAWTAVDAAEDEDKQDKVMAINAGGTANIAKACRAIDAKMVYISTDYVFNGQGTEPWDPDCRDYAPLSVYGKSKFAGEELVRQLCPDHCVCRISWLYGFGGPSFVHAMMNLADGSRPVLKVVADQHGNPTSALAVARQLGHLLERPKLRGTFHMTCEGEATWAEFAEEIFRIAGRRQAIQPCTTEEFPRPAPRPAPRRS